MQSISQAGFTDAEILDRLKSGEGVVGPLYQIVDTAGNILETLPTGETGVLSGEISVNADNDIKSQLALRMRPIASLSSETVAFQRWIRASFQLQMPNGQVLTWRMGDFLWINPNRSFWQDDALWEVTLGDRTQWLEYCSVPTNGFTAPQNNNNFDDLVNQILGLAGLPQNFPFQAGGTSETKTWSLTMPRKIVQWERQIRSHQKRGTAYGQRRAKVIQKKVDEANVTVSPTTLLAIINEMCDNLPTTNIMFSALNVAHLGEVSDHNILVEGSLFTFDMPWLWSAVETSINNSSICNRFAVIPQSGGGSPTFVDANTHYPLHPLRQAVIGRYIDNAAVYQGPVSATTFGRRNLLKLMGEYERVSFDAFLHPGMQVYDMISLHVPTSEKYATPRLIHVRQLEFDLDTGMMSVQGSRVYV